MQRPRTKAYPTTEEWHDFGRRICGVRQPAQVLARIAQAMHRTLENAQGNARVPPAFLINMREAWEDGLKYARESWTQRQFMAWKPSSASNMREAWEDGLKYAR